MPTAKILCHLPKTVQSANIFFADCPIFLAGGKEKQSAKTSFADCLAGGKEKLVAKVAAWQVAKESWWQRWRGTNGVAVLFATCQAVRQSAKIKFFIFKI